MSFCNCALPLLLLASLSGCCLEIVTGDVENTGGGRGSGSGTGSPPGSSSGSTSAGTTSTAGTSSSSGTTTGAEVSPFSGLTVIASGQSGACGLCVDTHNVYWQTTNAVSALPLAGGSVTVLAGGLNSPSQIACDGTNVYWNDNAANTVTKVPVDGGGSTQLATSPAQPTAIAVQAGEVYWGTDEGSLYSVSALGGGRNQILAGNDGANIWSIWPTLTLLLFTDHTSGEVRTTPLGGNNWSTLGSSTGGGGDLAANGQSVYWSCGEAGGSLNEVPEAGGTSQVVETGQNGIIGVAIDDQNVYWVNLFGGQVAKRSLSSGVMTTIASDRNNPCMIALSGSTVYWTEAGSGLLMAAPK